MSLSIYNTLGRTIMEFLPLEKGKVKMYVCGVTVYDYPHLGHGRAYVVFDTILRYLRYKGYEVTYARNVTDIDDKIIAKANESTEIEGSLREKVSYIAEKYLKTFYEDMEKLNVAKADHEPRATEYIDEIIKIIETLVRKEIAYESEGNVWFSVEKFPEYGKLSGRSIEELISGARVEPDPTKRNPLDFALWKRAKEDEPSWKSPWGNGRPGWHIECSTMSIKLLGEQFDIHGGGQDLIFPHHENEIAQSKAYTGKEPVKYWIHNGFVTINKEKMSKSLGNFFTLRQIFEKYQPEIVRFFLLGQHYRSPIDFSNELLEESKHAVERIRDCINRVSKVLNSNKISAYNTTLFQHFLEKFHNAMDMDFNTARAIGIIFEIVKEINLLLGRQGNLHDLKAMYNTLMKILNVLGIKITVPQVIFVKKDNQIEDRILANGLLEKGKLNNSEIYSLLSIRNYARAKKDWALADKIRNKLIKQGYTLRDTPEGTELIP